MLLWYTLYSFQIFFLSFPFSLISFHSSSTFLRHKYNIATNSAFWFLFFLISSHSSSFPLILLPFLRLIHYAATKSSFYLPFFLYLRRRAELIYYSSFLGPTINCTRINKTPYRIHWKHINFEQEDWKEGGRMARRVRGMGWRKGGRKSRRDVSRSAWSEEEQDVIKRLLHVYVLPTDRLYGRQHFHMQTWQR